MGNVKDNGGARKGSGRKPKAKEIELIESLDKYIKPDKAFKILEGLVNKGNFAALKLYFEYRYGRPKETKEVTLIEEQPLFPE